ncbi:hypothetical protein GUJ93_ZPchr0011g28458 [Zizania palustris]|uniref:DYW domain-containing protein n=1 Tax=Zizania palustris TaxID=103762 RepID=A0A8J5WKZ7_ZIZPA|nr:hypothetical protein GUJ93_ZPchr0011g28458 [Zizania palustris]
MQSQFSFPNSCSKLTTGSPMVDCSCALVRQCATTPVLRLLLPPLTVRSQSVAPAVPPPPVRRRRPHRPTAPPGVGYCGVVRPSVADSHRLRCAAIAVPPPAGSRRGAASPACFRADLLWRESWRVEKGEVGYITDTSSALHDTDEEQKGQNLWSHSEKLALAYGLIVVPVGSTVRIFKNLRVCSDCHLVFKLVSGGGWFSFYTLSSIDAYLAPSGELQVKRGGSISLDDGGPGSTSKKWLWSLSEHTSAAETSAAAVTVRDITGSEFDHSLSGWPVPVLILVLLVGDMRFRPSILTKLMAEAEMATLNGQYKA